jgi:glutamate dehydrogenase/leucine dehydrogenase
MSEKIMKEADEIGPEAMIYISDYETGLKGLLVIDSTACGPAGGGTRMLPDLTAAEIAGLARAMTNKYGILGLARGGCKAGIWGDPEMPQKKKAEILRAFGRELKPYLAPRIVALGPDMGVDLKEVVYIFEGAGMPMAFKGMFEQEIEGDTLEYHLTGRGVIVAAKAAFELDGMKLAGAKVAIEGFGKVGVGAARYAVKEGAKVVAISTIHEAIYNKNGLDVNKLFPLRKQLGDECLREYKDAEHIASSEIYFLPVDLLMPGARPYVLTKGNADKVKAKVVSEGANIPTTPEAEKILFKKGILSIPDFIANAGGVVAALVDYLGGNLDQAFKAQDNFLTKLVREVLTEARKKGIDPYTIATDKVRERVLEQRGKPKKTYDEALQIIKGQLGVF